MTLLLISCGNPERELKEAEHANTEQAYQEFIQKHSGGPLISKANSELADLLLLAYVKTNTVLGYQSFINRFPNTGAGKRARQCLERLEYTQATNDDTIDGYQAFIKRYPASDFEPVVNERLYDHIEERDLNKALVSDRADDYTAFLSRYPRTRTRNLIYEHLVGALSREGWSMRSVKASTEGIFMSDGMLFRSAK